MNYAVYTFRIQKNICWKAAFKKELSEAVVAGFADDVSSPADQEFFVISHSMGTVVAYEALHSFVNDPHVPGLTSGVSIKTLFTLGSPLAFLKTNQKRITTVNPNFFFISYRCQNSTIPVLSQITGLSVLYTSKRN